MNDQPTREQRLVLDALKTVAGFEDERIDNLGDGETIVLYSYHEVSYLLKADGTLEAM